MGYANPIEAMGVEAFAAAAREAGVDGVLVVDYPPEEAPSLQQTLNATRSIRSSCWRRLRAMPVLPGWRAGQRLYLLRFAEGRDRLGALDVAAVAARIPEIRARTGVPVGVGFGIRDAATAAAVAEIADAVVVRQPDHRRNRAVRIGQGVRQRDHPGGRHPSWHGWVAEA
jgi:tryptophan synthase alpha chain